MICCKQIGIMAFSLTACGNSASGNTTQQEAESMLEISERENDTDLNTVPADEVASADNKTHKDNIVILHVIHRANNLRTGII